MPSVEIDSVPNGTAVPERMRRTAEIVDVIFNLPQIRELTERDLQQVLLSAFMSVGTRLGHPERYADLAIASGAAWWAQQRVATGPDLDARAREVMRVGDMLVAVTSRENHSVVLQTLLSLFRSIATRNPCCLGPAAADARDAASSLTALAALSTAPTTGGVH